MFVCMCMHVSVSELVMRDAATESIHVCMYVYACVYVRAGNEKAATKSSLKDGDLLCRGWNARDHMHVALNPFQ